MRRVLGNGWLLTGVALVVGGCAHDPDAAPSRGTAVGTSPLAPFDSVDLPHPNSREQLAAALRQRGFLSADAPEGTTLNGALRAFQKSEDLPQSGYPDDETLRRLGIDPGAKDRTLDPAPVWREGATGAGVSH
ncbi:MAG TPA: peptidoglycan-binding domain-containing protein [Myxococcaceae bacterium]|nr:peptidoglycan-binding domain-containing protein [Myxococcaceae bacterium]